MTTPEQEDTTADKLSYALTLTGDGISIDRPVSAHIAVQIMSLAMGGSPTHPVPSNSSRASAGPSRGPSPTMAIREFLNDVGAKRNPDKIIAMATYLRDQQGRDNFSRDDVKGLFRKAGEPIPANYSRDFGVALASGWIAEDHETSGEYYVTKSGDETLASGFQTKVTRTRRKRNKRSPKDEGA